MATSSSAIQSRPYRSHRVPACTRCRSRKIRCHIDIPGEPCLSCRERRLKCQYADGPNASTQDDQNDEVRPLKRPRLGNGDAAGDSATRRHSAPVLHKPSTNPSASILLAPHIAEDVDILQRHISQRRTSDGEAPQTYQTVSHDIRNPVVYLSIPRHRIGIRREIGAGKEQAEIIEQIMGPFKQEVVDLYFRHIHHHLPVLDEETCDSIRKGAREVPKNLMCVVYANGALYWRQSDILKMHPIPDAHYVWNKAISAVSEDFLSPSIATVAASVLDQIGRPSFYIIGNVTLCGRNVSLAQMFGLHRDPSGWEISDNEKSTRIRVWWGVLITDYWSSVAYGAPPHVVRGFYDVPIPTPESLVSAKASMAQKYASTCFTHLCALTELLGDILTLVHHIRPDPHEFARTVDQRKASLNDLESRLPEWLPLPDKSGSTNLWFCFLSMRLLLSRVALRAAVLIGDANMEKSRLNDLRESSFAVLDFILFLGERQFQDFWLPYATHMLVLAVMVSLRCTVEAQTVEIGVASVARLERFMAHIQHARDNYDWDIAIYCLERCSDAVAKISSFVTRESVPPEATEAPNANVGGDIVPNFAASDDPNFFLSDILDPNALEFSWEALWDTPLGTTNFSI